MKRTIVIVLMLLTAFGAARAGENSLLWKISGNGLESPSWLFGTNHMLCPGMISIPDKVKEAMMQSEQLILELDFDDPAVMQKIQQGMIYKDGTTAADYLTDKEYKQVSTFFTDSMNLPFSQLRIIKPFFLSSITLIHYLGCQPVSMESSLIELSSEKEMEVKGLETVSDQLNFVESLPVDKQKEILLAQVTSHDSVKTMYKMMVDKYLEEDIFGLHEITTGYMTGEYSEFGEEMLVKRNLRWIPDIEEIVRDKSSFIAVGAGHLPGDDGVIMLLREKGYKVEAVL